MAEFLDKVGLLKKFGFREDDNEIFVHKKLNVELNVEQINLFLSLDELEEHIKHILRTS